MGILLNMSFHIPFWPLALVIGLAWAAPVLLSLFRITKVPTVIAEIILGYILGHFMLDHITSESMKILDFLALAGFIFLMFLSGLEINVDQITASLPRKKLSLASFLKNPLLVGISHFLLALILSYISTLVLAQIIDIPNLWYFSLIMVTTSVGIILPVLKNRGEIAGHYGQMIIIAAAVADIFSIILFSFTAFTLKHGFKIELLYIFVLFFALYIFTIVGRRLKQIPIFKKMGYQFSHSALQIRVRGTILVILGFVVIAQFIGEEEVLLGAFLSGLLLSSFMHKERSLLIVKMDGMGFGFFIPIFFIMVGMKFDTSAFAEFDSSIIWFLAALLVILFTVKIIPSMIWSRIFGFRRALAGGFLMSSRLSLIIAASAIGLEMNVITEGINASFILMAVVTCLISPIIFNALNPGNILSGSKTIIVGGSSTAVLLARRLHVHGKKSIIIEKNIDRFRDIQNKGLNAILENGCQEAVYREIHLSANNYVVLECGSDEDNLIVGKMLRKQFQHENIISRSQSKTIEKQLQLINVDTIDERRVLATTIENLILRPNTYHNLVESFDNYSVEEIQVINSEVDGKQIREIPFHSEAILMMIKSGESLSIPHGDTYLRKGDIIHVFGTNAAMEATHLMVE
ncbi:MAG: cation:proton antiporter [Bacteroidales bacterium]|nr:cation:proton antiporter [Bacteroidales bacterium]